MPKRTALLLLAAALSAALGFIAARLLFHAPAPVTLPAPNAITLLPSPRALPAFQLQQAEAIAARACSVTSVIDSST